MARNTSSSVRYPLAAANGMMDRPGLLEVEQRELALQSAVEADSQGRCLHV
jgi:hypothetical protein